MDVELTEIRDFLAQHAPFDALPPVVLERLPRSCTLRYARRGAVVVEAGVRGDGLYVVRSGAVDILDETGGLIERIGTGGAFGMSSLLEHRLTRHRSTAVEDTLLVVLAADRFEELTREHPSFLTFFAAAHHTRLSRAIRNLQQASSGHTVLRTPVRTLLTRDPVATAPTTSITEASRVMTAAGVSCVLVIEDERLVGIVTDRDLRTRVLAAGLDPATPVGEVMTSRPRTLRVDAMAFEALLEMVTRRIHHLPVVDERQVPLGLVTTTDLVRLEKSNPVYLAADIGAQTTVAGVVAQAQRIPAVLGELVASDVSAADLARVLTALGDAVRRRLVALAEAEVGPPPTAYSWVVLGSAAREEEALSADQDHALVVAEEGHDAWFAELAERVSAGLAEAGWPRCPGEVMATNPRWRLTPDEWRRHFAAWSREPQPDAVLHVAVFHDMRHLIGDPDLTEQVRRSAADHVSPRLVSHLVARALEARPPLGFFRTFVLEHEGDHRDTLDIKRAIAIVVQLARVQALRVGSTALSTSSRLAAAEEGGLLDEGTAEDLRIALELMSYLRLHHQVSQARAGHVPDNKVAPRDLTDRQRHDLKDAFAVVRAAQQQLSTRLSSGFV